MTLTLNKLLSALVKPLELAVSCFALPARSICRLVNVTRPLPAFVPMSRLVSPNNAPVPELSVMVTSRLAGKPTAESLPNWSWLLSAG